MKDRYGFLLNVTNWNNHRPLLLNALENTQGDVIELGMGDGSTRFLHDYCEDKKRLLISIDNNPDWAGKFSQLSSPLHNILCTLDNNWHEQRIEKHWGVALVDNAPGEDRWELIKRLKDHADIIVVHDSEPAATGYMLNKVFGYFKYKADLQSNGAWASVISNKVDVREWIGKDIFNEDQESSGQRFQISKYTMRPVRTVILSSNDNPDYLKYYPYVAWAWNQLGWETLLFYQGKHSALLEEYKPIKEHFDSERNKIIPLSVFEGYRPETVTQVSRLFGGLIYSDNRMLMTGDVDMIPLSDYWNPTENNITCFGWDLTDHTQYPICYIAMTANKWRETMRLTDKDLLDVQIKRMLDSSPLPKSDKFEEWWSFDQEYITNLLKNEPTVQVPRGKDGILAIGRADRYNWDGTKDKGQIDAHMPRPFNLDAVKSVLLKAFNKFPEWL